MILIPLTSRIRAHTRIVYRELYQGVCADTVEREEFAALIIHMASADLRSSQLLEDSPEQQMCEGDCEVSAYMYERHLRPSAERHNPPEIDKIG